MSPFALGLRSHDRLAKCHPDLQAVVRRAIELTACDFTVFETARTLERQKELVAKGMSWTLKSRHIPSVAQDCPECGPVAHAVDLVPLLDTDGDGDKEATWDWPGCYLIAKAMQQAAKELNVAIVWGGVWDKGLEELLSNFQKEVADYSKRQKAKGKSSNPDGPHFQLDWTAYP